MCLIKAHVAKSSVRKSDVLTRINIVRNRKGKIRSIKSEWSLALPFNQTLVCEFLHDIKIQLSILGKKAGHWQDTSSDHRKLCWQKFMKWKLETRTLKLSCINSLMSNYVIYNLWEFSNVIQPHIFCNLLFLFRRKTKLADFWSHFK